MPQLNPSPWLGILILSWLALFSILLPKVMSHAFPNEPTPPNLKTSKTNTWNWPWL